MNTAPTKPITTEIAKVGGSIYIAINYSRFREVLSTVIKMGTKYCRRQGFLMWAFNSGTAKDVNK